MANIKNFAETPVGAPFGPLGFVPLMSIRRAGRIGEQQTVSDDFVQVNDDQQHRPGRALADVAAWG
nr:hypothetical protein MFLOJ_38840 [Mycobacterium florentinum]